MKDLLRVENLTIEFGVHEGILRAVDSVSFSIPPGGAVALVGESGSGKSVCSQAIMGLLPRAASIPAGSIFFKDPRDDMPVVDIAKLSPSGPEMRTIRGGEISIIFQEPMTSLSALHTVGDQIGEAVELHGAHVGRGGARTRISRAEIDEITISMLHMVGFPDPKRALRTYPFELSGGLRQRAMIAMALVCRPALLIADEPTTALDVTIQAQILKLIVELQRELGMAVLLITHDLGVVANVAEEIVVMYHGEIMESGTLNEVFREPRHPYLRALLRAVPHFDMQPGERLQPIREIPPGDAPHQMAFKAQAPATANGPLLQCTDIRKSFGLRSGGLFRAGEGIRVTAVDGVSLSVGRGECLGLVGESGCGKTTLSKILLRALPPDSGEVVFNDNGEETDVLALEGDALKRFRQRVQFIFQDPYGSLNPRMNVHDILAEPLIIHDIGDARTRREMVAELVTLVGLDVRDLRKFPHSFSGGQRQRIGIARALALRPDLVICDEPVSALDVSIQAQILNLLIDLQKKLGLTYLFISHNLAVVDYIADRIAVMCAGRIVEMAPRGVLFRNPVHPYTQALLAAIPVPDPAHPLDFGQLIEGRCSDPKAWSEPFRRVPGTELRRIEIGPGHWVEASAMPRPAPVREASLAGPL